MSLSKENKVIIDGQTYYGGVNQPPKFVKVNVDCWEKIFDYLSLRDILSMSQTCLRMRQIGGYYFRENFHGTKCCLDIDSSWIDMGYVRIELASDDFLRFVDKFWIEYDLKRLRRYSGAGVLGSLTTLHLRKVHLNANTIDNFESSVLDNIETIELTDGTIHSNFDGQLFASCPKLKCLRINGLNYALNTIQKSLLRYTYPMLEHFEYMDCRESVSLFKSFLERNSSIKSLRIDADYLLKIGLKTSKIKLFCLSVGVIDVHLKAVKLANRLKALYANGFYQKLHLSLGSSSDNEMFINEMKSFSALEVLYTSLCYANICHLTELKELHLNGWLVGGVNLQSIARKLTKLERLRIHGTVAHLIPFLRYSKALNVAVLQDYNANPLNLSDLNQVRQIGASQRKVSIGLCEKPYLPTQWKSKNVKYDFVEIKRAETIRERFVYQLW